MDFSETPSIVMETLSLPYWDEYYQGEALLQAQREFFEEIPGWTLDDAVIEAFQLWIYTHVDEARDASQCDAKWLELTQRYLPNVDYMAHSTIIAMGWQRVMTLFYMPIFAMEYGYGRIAGLNLLQIAEEDSASAITRYKQSLLNGSDLKASFSALGTDFFFTPDDVAKAARQMEKYLS
jgi:oligoendopeptidase F